MGSQRAPTNDDLAMRDRVMQLQWQQEAFDERLRSGAATFEELRGSIKALHDQISPKRPPTLKILGFAFSVATLVFGLIWAAAKYPNRDEFDAARADTAQQIRAIEHRQVQIATEQRLIREAVRRQEATQVKIGDKLDRLLEQRMRPAGRRR